MFILDCLRLSGRTSLFLFAIISFFCFVFFAVEGNYRISFFLGFRVYFAVAGVLEDILAFDPALIFFFVSIIASGVYSWGFLGVRPMLYYK